MTGTIALLLPETKTARYETADRPDFEAKFKELCPDCQIIYSNANQDANAQLSQAQAALTTAKLNLAKMELGSRPEEIAAAQAAVQLAKAALNDVADINDNERTTASARLTSPANTSLSV